MHIIWDRIAYSGMDSMVAKMTKTLSGKDYRRLGHWLDKTIDQLLIDAAAKSPEKVAIAADRADRAAMRRFTYSELDDIVNRVANAFRRLGIKRSDVVTVQLPNWWEFVVTSLACSRIGAVINPVMPILRERELLYILNFCAAKVFIIPK